MIVGYNTKVVERGGRKLKHLLSNTNPWKGLPCGREECQPCGQPGEKKDDCRNRSITYENVCKKCNPGDMLKKKKEENMEDIRPEPSIYVGESSRSLHERAGDHWRDCRNKLEDSHMFKHWMTAHHDDNVPPEFEIRVVKYCSTALERQTGWI